MSLPSLPPSHARDGQSAALGDAQGAAVEPSAPNASWRGWLAAGCIVALPLAFGIFATQNQTLAWLLARFAHLLDVFAIIGGVISCVVWACGGGSGQDESR